MKNYQITEWCHHFIKEQVKPGDICIDATMGNGHDTELLCRLAGAQGHVLAFDIQEEALKNTESRLKNADVPHNFRLLLESHENMKNYAAAGTVSCIVFNFGYLPGGDHAKRTLPQTSVLAVEQGLSLLKKGGLLSLCIYSGGDTGYLEKDAVLSYVKGLNPKKYLAIRSSYYNRPGSPPIPVLIIKLE